MSEQELTVLEAKRYGIFGCQPETTLVKAAERMVREDISALVITDEEGSLAGVITHTDLLRACRLDADWKVKPVTAYMSRDVVTVTESTRLWEVTDLLLKHGIHRVVVVRHEGHKQVPVAVVSSSDLVYHLIKERLVDLD